MSSLLDGVRMGRLEDLVHPDTSCQWGAAASGHVTPSGVTLPSSLNSCPTTAPPKAPHFPECPGFATTPGPSHLLFLS